MFTAHQHEQDWQVVKLRGKHHVQAERLEKERQRARTANAASKTANGDLAWKIEKRADADDGPPIARVSKEDAKIIAQMRQKGGFTREQLANQLNIPVKQLLEVESGQALENKALVHRIKQTLTRLASK